VYIGSQARIVGEIPAGVIGVFVDHDRIGIPKPIVDIGVIKRSDAPVEVVEPESLPVSSLQVENVAWPEATIEMPVLKGMREMEPLVTGSGIVPYPVAVALDVRRVGVARCVAKVTLRGCVGLRCCVLLRGGVLLRRGAFLRCSGLHGRGAVRWNKSSTGTATTVFLPSLCVYPNRGEEQKRYRKAEHFLHDILPLSRTYATLCQFWFGSALILPSASNR
jgi:hypothetical protein